MRSIIIFAALCLSLAPVAAADQGGCASIYRSDPTPQGKALQLDGPRLEHRPARVLAGLEESIAGPTADRQIDVLWTRFEQRNQWIVNEQSDARTGVCLDAGDDGFDYFAGQVLDGPAQQLPESFSTLELPASPYAVFTLTGQAADIAAAHALIYNARLFEAGFTPADAPDLLVFPPGFSPARRNATIELWIPLAP